MSGQDSNGGNLNGGGDQTSTSSASVVTTAIATSTSNGLEVIITATTTITPSPTTSAASHSDNTPYSSGELAGGIVGAAIGSALLTFMATFLLFRKKSGRRQSSYGLRRPYDSDPSTISDEKPASAPWQAYLRQSADDRAIKNDVKGLFDQVELHVENFYRKASVKPDANLAAALARIDSGQLSAPIEELIHTPKLAKSVIKHVLSNMLVARMSPAAGQGYSLLPAHLTMNPSKLQSSTLRSQEAPAARQAYSEWKRLNAYLCPQPEDDSDFIQERNRVTNEMSDSWNAALSPWRAQVDENTFRQHERSLIATASSVAIKLMSQSWDYKFVFEETGISVESAIVTAPGLSKVTDDSGVLLQRPQLLVAPTVVRI